MKKSVVVILSAAVGLIGCSQDAAMEENAASTVEFAFEAVDDASRVTLNHDELTYEWEGGEKVVVSYAPVGTQSYTTIPCEFVACNAGRTTRFEADVPSQYADMGEENQDYVMVYPYVRPEGGKLGYTIGAVADGCCSQQAAFESNYNLMRAAGEGVSFKKGTPALTFEHLLTSLRFYVKLDAEAPYRNLEVNSLEIEFPQPVVGPVEVDPATGVVTATAATLNKLTVNLPTPIVPIVSYKAEDGCNADNYALVVALPFEMQAGSTLAVKVCCSAEDADGKRCGNLTQTVSVKATRAMTMAAGRFRAVPLNLKADAFERTTDSRDFFTAAFAPADDYASGVTVLFDKKGELLGYHAMVSEVNNERHIVLDNTSNRWESGLVGSRLFKQSAFYMPNSVVLEGYSGGDIVVSFDAHVVFSGNDRRACPIAIAFNHCSIRTNGQTGDGGYRELVVVDAEPALMTAKDAKGAGYPLDSRYWRSYSVTIPASMINGIENFMSNNSDGTPPHMGFRLDGKSLGSSKTDGRMVYIRNVSYSYAKSF